MPAEALAALSPADRLDIEAQSGAQLLVHLVAEGRTLAVASLAQVDGRLIATIIESGVDNNLNSGPGLPGQRIDQWKHRKAKTTA